MRSVWLVLLCRCRCRCATMLVAGAATLVMVPQPAHDARRYRSLRHQADRVAVVPARLHREYRVGAGNDPPQRASSNSDPITWHGDLLVRRLRAWWSASHLRHAAQPESGCHRIATGDLRNRLGRPLRREQAVATQATPCRGVESGAGNASPGRVPNRTAALPACRGHSEQSDVVPFSDTPDTHQI